MTVLERFEATFSKDNLKKIFENKIASSRSTGIDNLTAEKFNENLDENLSIASRKILSGTYKFTKYKQKLISKGKGKKPREISIPAVRDKIILRALNEFLSKQFSNSIKPELPHTVIRKVKSKLSCHYDAFIKLDVSEFYPSIQHKHLKSRLKKRIKEDLILKLIFSAIETPTVQSSRKSDEISKVGVPQGLAISNVLASIYLINIDRRYNKRTDFAYFRYVDDILILCKESNSQEIASDIITKFKSIGLTIHKLGENDHKSKLGNLSYETFSYLGYEFLGSNVGVRSSTVERLRDRLVSIFTSYKYSKRKDIDRLMWKLNLRITGCIYEKKAKGWVFFFSEITNEKIFHELDYFTLKLMNRFNITKTPKKFVKTYKEITLNKHKTTYIPNFDNYTLDNKSSFLKNSLNKDISALSDQEIENMFSRIVQREIKDLQEDLKDLS